MTDNGHCQTNLGDMEGNDTRRERTLGRQGKGRQISIRNGEEHVQWALEDSGKKESTQR